jgi:hypothetical protein
LKVQSVVFDGEGVWCGQNGFSDFAKLHSRGYDDEVTYFAFDLLEPRWRKPPIIATSRAQAAAARVAGQKEHHPLCGPLR